MGIVNDFIVDSNQHCFLCLTQISQSANHLSVKVEPGSQYSQSQSVHSPPIYSIQYLSRYVDVDMLKVFNSNDTPLHLIDKVRRSKLNVELCGDCANLNANFSQRLRQLEKLEMELGVSLSRILDKLLEAEKLRREEKFQNLEASESSGLNVLTGVKGKLEIMKALRTDVMEKCSSKLAQIPPRVSIPKPNPNRKMNMNMNKLKFSYGFGSRKKQAMIRSPSLRFTGRISHGHFETTGAWAGSLEPIPTPSQECQPTEEITGGGNNLKVWLMPPPPVTVDTSSISSSVGSSPSAQENVEDYACGMCGMRFMFPGNLQFHSQMVHNKTIPRSSLPKRQVRKLGKSIVTCRRCGSVFSRMKYLQRHLKSAHANELGHACKHCGLKFGTKIQLKTHRRLEHKLDDELITPDYPHANQEDYSTSTVPLPVSVSEAVPDLETVETRIVKVESNYDPLVVVPLPSAEDGSREISATSLNSHPHNDDEDWLTGLSQLSKTVGECKGSNAQSEMECDICHLMVTDISTHLYTVHFEQSGDS